MAELGNGSVDIVDVQARKVIKRISGLDEPQGVAFAPKADVLAVSCGGDGTVRLYDGKTYAPRGVVKLGDDADDAHLDTATEDIVIAYGDGGLAIIDPATAAVVKTIPLPAHPEGFQIDGNRAFVNVPDADQIDVVNLNTGKRVATWPLTNLSANFPMALGERGLIAVGFRSPDVFGLFNRTNGQMAAKIADCGTADDIDFDAKLGRYYVSCGSGEIDTFALNGGRLLSAGRMRTIWGARTSLFVPQLNRLFLAVRAGLLFGSNASIRIYQPLP
ncbi:MAG: hypothetical protein KGO02_15680 [Alphaproteobacteria bacterium]|nr:hypothetical protein [Alphaproteobacteria bacterium]